MQILQCLRQSWNMCSLVEELGTRVENKVIRCHSMVNQLLYIVVLAMGFGVLLLVQYFKSRYNSILHYSLFIFKSSLVFLPGNITFHFLHTFPVLQGNKHGFSTLASKYDIAALFPFKRYLAYEFSLR
jgi:hypothetical protein